MINFLKKLSIALFVFSQVCLNAQGGNQIPPFTLLTIPKSGSHLIIKALHFLTGGESIWHTRFPSLHYIAPENGFLYTHFCLSPELEDDYTYLPHLKKIVMLRDLRDVSISIVNQIRKSHWPGMTKNDREEFLNMTFDEQLLFVINYDYDVEAIASLASNSLQVSLNRVAMQSYRYFQDPDNCVVRYEDLVGSQGGGNDEVQINELRRLTDFLNIQYTDEKLLEVSSKLYGNEYNPFGKKVFKNFNSTFHQGQVGNWRSIFKDEHKSAFKQKLGHWLLAFGYEPNNEW